MRRFGMLLACVGGLVVAFGITLDVSQRAYAEADGYSDGTQCQGTLCPGVPPPVDPVWSPGQACKIDIIDPPSFVYVTEHFVYGTTPPSAGVVPVVADASAVFLYPGVAPALFPVDVEAYVAGKQGFRALTWNIGIGVTGWVPFDCRTAEPTSTTTTTTTVAPTTTTTTTTVAPTTTTTTTTTVAPTTTTTTTIRPPTEETSFANAYVTSYGWWDNNPPASAAICCPAVHNEAAGTGTYADPLTVAVDFSSGTTLQFAPGTRFYIPNLRAYFVAEDRTGEQQATNTQLHDGSNPHLDVWSDGRALSPAELANCQSSITHTGLLVIQNPQPNYLVVPGSLTSNNTCRANYGNTVVFG
jgi:hypothetical protein